MHTYGKRVKRRGLVQIVQGAARFSLTAVIFVLICKSTLLHGRTEHGQS